MSESSPESSDEIVGLGKPNGSSISPVQKLGKFNSLAIFVH